MVLRPVARLFTSSLLLRAVVRRHASERVHWHHHGEHTHWVLGLCSIDAWILHRHLKEKQLLLVLLNGVLLHLHYVLRLHGDLLWRQWFTIRAISVHHSCRGHLHHHLWIKHHWLLRELTKHRLLDWLWLSWLLFGLLWNGFRLFFNDLLVLHFLLHNNLLSNFRFNMMSLSWSVLHLFDRLFRVRRMLLFLGLLGLGLVDHLFATSFATLATTFAAITLSATSCIVFLWTALASLLLNYRFRWSWGHLLFRLF